MATKDFVEFTPSTGSRSKTITVSVSENENDPRSVDLNIKGQGITKTVSINQNAGSLKITSYSPVIGSVFPPTDVPIVVDENSVNTLFRCKKSVASLTLNFNQTITSELGSHAANLNFYLRGGENNYLTLSWDTTSRVGGAASIKISINGKVYATVNVTVLP